MAPHVFIVIPMLNEEETLVSTCSSLGAFRRVTERQFVLVDNGSMDRTWSVAHEIQTNAVHPIHVVDEEERGHVPARRTGCRVARELALLRGWPIEEVIICQADADTIYDDDYVDQMTAAMVPRSVAVYEGRSILRADEKQAAPIANYLNSSAETDRLVEHCLVSEEDDVIVDDKVSAYYLSDYFRWGEHQREYTARGDELLAETTRLYMRAISAGAARVRVNNAFARHSTRRILAEMWMHFASAGFPREASWRELHRCHIFDGQISADSEAVHLRLCHLLGLFALLPEHVAVTSHDRASPRFSGFLPSRTLDQLRSSPGLLLEDVLDVIDHRGDELIRACHLPPVQT